MLRVGLGPGYGRDCTQQDSRDRGQYLTRLFACCVSARSDWAASLLTSLVQRNVELVLLDFSSSDHWENEPWATNAER